MANYRDERANPQSPSGLIHRFSRGQVLAERCQDLGSGAKTWDFSGQRPPSLDFSLSIETSEIDSGVFS